MTGPIIAEIYLGKITTVERPGDQEAEPGCQPAEHEDHAGLPLGRLRHDLQLHRLPVGGQPRVQVEDRQLDAAVSFPAGVGGRGSSGVAGVVKNTEGAIGYVDIAYALANHIQFMSVRNAAGKFVTPGLRVDHGGGRDRQAGAANNELHIVNPPKTSPLAYPISTFTYVILPTKTDKAAELRKFVFYALTQGQKFGPKRSSCRSRRRAGRGREDPEEGQGLAPTFAASGRPGRRVRPLVVLAATAARSGRRENGLAGSRRSSRARSTSSSHHSSSTTRRTRARAARSSPVSRRVTRSRCAVTPCRSVCSRARSAWASGG